MLYSYNTCVEKYGTKYLMKKAVESGELFCLEKGIYSDEKYVSEDAIIAMKYPRAVFTLDSAFYYHGLTDVIPEKYYLSTDRNATKISDNRIVQIFEQANILYMGATEFDRNGYSIPVYTKERLLVELLRHKTKLPFDYYKEVLLNFRNIVHSLDIRAVQDYAERVPKTARIMEILQLEVL